LNVNPIYETNCNFMCRQNQDNYFEDDWQDNAVPESLRHFKHCYSFHHLYDHTDFNWYDLSLVEEIWIEIKVDYQFFTALK